MELLLRIPEEGTRSSSADVAQIATPLPPAPGMHFIFDEQTTLQIGTWLEVRENPDPNIGGLQLYQCDGSEEVRMAGYFGTP